MIARRVVKSVWHLLPQPLRKTLRQSWVNAERRTRYRRLPIAMITGTKGKTTTSRMLTHILAEAGHHVGLASTDGVMIDGVWLHREDASGINGARTVLESNGISAAVLETARGHVVRYGFFLDRSNAAALLNVGREQIGLDGVDTIEQMTLVKRRVTDTARDAVILNADDASTVGLIDDYPRRRVILFSMDSENPTIDEHRRAGGRAFVLRGSAADGVVERHEGPSVDRLLDVSELPTAAGGLFPQNIANALAAAALAEGLGVPLRTTATALSTFQMASGRLEIASRSPLVLIDRAASPAACETLVDSLAQFEVTGRRLCMVQSNGNRADWHFTEIGELLAPQFDHVVCYEFEASRAGLAPGEVAQRLAAGFVSGGLEPEQITMTNNPVDATRLLANMCDEDDLVVVLHSFAQTFLPMFETEFGIDRGDGDTGQLASSPS